MNLGYYLLNGTGAAIGKLSSFGRWGPWIVAPWAQGLSCACLFPHRPPPLQVQMTYSCELPPKGGGTQLLAAERSRRNTSSKELQLALNYLQPGCRLGMFSTGNSPRPAGDWRGGIVGGGATNTWNLNLPLKMRSWPNFLG